MTAMGDGRYSRIGNVVATSESVMSEVKRTYYYFKIWRWLYIMLRSTSCVQTFPTAAIPKSVTQEQFL